MLLSTLLKSLQDSCLQVFKCVGVQRFHSRPELAGAGFEQRDLPGQSTAVTAHEEMEADL